MISRIKAIPFLVFFTISFSVYCKPVSTSNEAVSDLSKEYSIKSTLLAEFIESYNFKCPDEINETQLRDLLKDRYAENQLNIMIESDNLGWRDIYVEARSDITCLTDGTVSKGY